MHIFIEKKSCKILQNFPENVIWVVISKQLYVVKLSSYIKEQLKGTDHVGTFIGLKCVVYYANYRSGNQSSKIQVVP